MHRLHLIIGATAIAALVGCGNKAEIGLSFITDSGEAKSCVMYDEGCGDSEALFAPKLDPDCGLEEAGKEVTISGTFAAQLNMLSQTYVPWPIDKWKPAASTQYGYVVIQPDPEDPKGKVMMHRRYCMYYNTRVLGAHTIYYAQLFYNLKTFSYPIAAVDDSVWRVGDAFNLYKGWTTWGIDEEFDPFTMESPGDKGDKYVIDEDQDGKPGVTITVESDISLVAGDFYIVQSCTFDEELTICSENQMQGYRVRTTPTDQKTLDTTALTGQNALSIETKPGSTVLYIKISQSIEMPVPEVICEDIMARKDFLFGGEGAGESGEEIIEEE